jgi:uncharacterized protein (DUF1800 family)
MRRISKGIFALFCLLTALISVMPSAGATAAQQIFPQRVTLGLGIPVGFKSVGATKWTATVGTISSAGIYVPPKVMPKSATVTITATGPGGSVSAVVTLITKMTQVISPVNTSTTLGGTYQFTAAGATDWFAEFGTVSSTGLYKAPASGTTADLVVANGVHGYQAALILLTKGTTATPPATTSTGLTITSVSNAGVIPLGPYSITVSGTNFASGAVVKLNGASLTTTFTGGVLSASGFATKEGAGTLQVVSGGKTSAAYPVYLGLKNAKATAAGARRFLEQAAFGPTPADALSVQQLGYSAWIQNQFTMARCATYSGITAVQGLMPEHFLTDAVECNDQLRQRVAFALSQIFVASLDKLIFNQNMTYYQDMLLNDSFTNYRTIMNDVTTSAAMGQYLDMANNAKADPTTGTVANENYAREFMQLFTIGTNALNADGTMQLDSSGQPIPTYSQKTVTEFARVYTGWTYANAQGAPAFWAGNVAPYGIMVPYPSQHDTGSKTLLNGYVSPAGATPQQDLKNALDNVFNHSNVGPFVCKQLIQHLVKSNPSPAYVSRVAAVFNSNASKVRGDMKSVITAILMDPEARANDDGGEETATDGHLQEPALFIAGMVRAFGGTMNDANWYPYDMYLQGESVFFPSSVFNYYAPDYGIQGTNLEGGEFQIYTTDNAVQRANLVGHLFRAWASNIQTYGTGTSVDISPYVALAGNPTAMVDALDLTLTHGNMPAAAKAIIVTAVTGETGGNLRRAQRGCYLFLTSAYYNVWH